MHPREHAAAPAHHCTASRSHRRTRGSAARSVGCAQASTAADALQPRDGTGTSSSRSGRARTYVPESDMDKLQSTLKQFVREWGAGGHLERDAAHTPLLKALGAALPRGAEDGARACSFRAPGSAGWRGRWRGLDIAPKLPSSPISCSLPPTTCSTASSRTLPTGGKNNFMCTHGCCRRVM